MRYTQVVALGCGLLGPSARSMVESNLFAYISIFDTPSSEQHIPRASLRLPWAMCLSGFQPVRYRMRACHVTFWRAGVFLPHPLPCPVYGAPTTSFSVGLSDNALSHHGLGNLHEAGHVGTLHVVDIAVGLGTVLHTVIVDVLHDPVQLVVHFFRRPRDTAGVL